MICEACRERRHGDCTGGTWCDCQHRPSEGEDVPESDADDGPEPKVNWLRQG